MGAVFEPLDRADAQALAEELMSPDDARVMDEPEPETGQDSERLVVLEDRREGDTDQELEPGVKADIEDEANPAPQ
ncbi:hypothetical protein BLJ79_17790 [Arthrobacter sp. UCD-GKA]|uniref:hypothetical protein n=1 Tax=Arthrobacter sp. UCD-GKA TaxID=1913576 RepID=UPI0008DE0763|nr:hypothetical protein [Arthrobacter sp. UCD-GKA]OIH82803.1 hypothetical protein BLJ79_17790 [Arthrobacter sp. UCD-GKA]